MLAGDKVRTEALRTLKNALQYETVNLKLQDTGLDDEQVQTVLAREAKKRTEASDLYKQAGADDKSAAELAEKAIIETYLPAQLSEDEIKPAVEAEVAKLESPGIGDMGKVIGAVRAKLGASADGVVIARLVKELLN